MGVDVVVSIALWEAVCNFEGCTGFRSGTLILGVVGVDRKLYTELVVVVDRVLWSM